MRWGRAQLAALLPAVLALAVASGAAGSTLHLKGVGESAIEGERVVQEIAGELRFQDGWEWRAISGRENPAEVREVVEESAGRVERLLEEAGRLGLSPAGVAALQEGQLEYLEVIEEELRLLAAGEDEAAAEFDESRVDPTYEELFEELDSQIDVLHARAVWAQRLSSGGVVLTVVLSLGLTALIQRWRRLAEVRREQERLSEARYRALIDQSSDLVFVTDRTGRLSYLSPSAERIAPQRPAAHGSAAEGATDLAELVHPDDRAGVRAVLAGVGHHGRPSASVDARLGSAASGWRSYELSARDLLAEDAVGGIVLTAHDVTERLTLQEEMTHRALHDPLTGLPNRVLLADRIEQALRGARRGDGAAGLLLIDLDRFKEVNDTLGHHVGDQLLVQVGARLSGALRDVDTVARLGGDEFAVLLPAVGDADGGRAVAAKLLAAIQAPFRVGDLDLHVDASFGLVVSGEHGDDGVTLLQRADVAMYVAKQQDLRVFTYDPSQDGHSPERLALVGDLRRALTTDELVLHFQPQVSLSTGEVCSAEALVRWQHPTLGLLPPDRFIPLAEHTALIGPLTQHVLDLALRQARRWMDAGRPLQVSVNISSRNLLDDRLPAQVTELLARHDVPASLLMLEVTETAIMAEPVRAVELLGRLHALGVRISIDDFGAGYTSLGQLKDLPVTELKIDRSFVMTMAEDRSNGLIVHSVIDLGHNLGMSTVAEGVESGEVLTTLAGQGCDVVQGYHLSRPLPADAFDDWRSAWSDSTTPSGARAAVDLAVAPDAVPTG